MSDQGKNKVREVVDALDKLSNNYRKLFRACYDALASGKTQAERNAVRDALNDYVNEK